jgi:RNA polymerase sigma-70 factor (family 1)
VSLSDHEIITGLRIGNEGAFEVVFRTYYERLCNYANNMIYVMDEAEEMVQNTFLILWEKRESIEIHTSVKAYLYRAVHNSCLNRIKHNKVRQMHSDHLRYQSELSSDESSQRLMSQELERQINIAIESLPRQCRTVFSLSRFENLTYTEIAEQLGMSVNTVENHMVKALRILREKLKDYLPLLLWLLFSRN